MKPTLPITIFILAELLATGFILLTVGQLPQTIASHFNSVGVPNGFMTHRVYTVFMLVFVLGIPMLVVALIPRTINQSTDKINIPNKEYWLSSERREDTIRFLKSHLVWLGTWLVTFISYMHWLLLQANASAPPRLPAELFLPGIAMFTVAVFLWAGWIIAKFLRIP